MLQLLLGEHLLDVDLALDSCPSLGVVLHERFAVARIVIQTIRHACLVCGICLALLQRVNVLLSQTVVVGVADLGKSLHGVRVRDRHFC